MENLVKLHGRIHGASKYFTQHDLNLNQGLSIVDLLFLVLSFFPNFSGRHLIKQSEENSLSFSQLHVLIDRSLAMYFLS